MVEISAINTCKYIHIVLIESTTQQRTIQCAARVNWFPQPMVVDVTTLKMARKPMKLQKESPAGCAGEGKQSKGN